jgi:hypothetical protein
MLPPSTDPSLAWLQFLCNTAWSVFVGFSLSIRGCFCGRFSWHYRPYSRLARVVFVWSGWQSDRFSWRLCRRMIQCSPFSAFPACSWCHLRYPSRQLSGSFNKEGGGVRGALGRRTTVVAAKNGEGERGLVATTARRQNWWTRFSINTTLGLQRSINLSEITIFLAQNWMRRLRIRRQGVHFPKKVFGDLTMESRPVRWVRTWT